MSEPTQATPADSGEDERIREPVRGDTKQQVELDIGFPDYCCVPSHFVGRLAGTISRQIRSVAKLPQEIGAHRVSPLPLIAKFFD